MWLVGPSPPTTASWWVTVNPHERSSAASTVLSSKQ